jgi:putative membrane protein insertion efficiency factor
VVAAGAEGFYLASAARAVAMMNRFLRSLIRLYQLTLSPMLGMLDCMGGGCRFEPTCSKYCMEALREHGTLRGLWLGIKRLGRCAPWGGLGYDPVPPRHQREGFSVPPVPPVG